CGWWAFRATEPATRALAPAAGRHFGCGLGGSVGGANGRGDLAIAQTRRLCRSPQSIERVRGRDAVLGEAAGGPEQAAVPLALTSPGDPRRQPLPIHGH